MVDGPGIRGRCETGEDRNAVNNGASNISSRIASRRAYPVVSRAGIKGVEWEVADEKVLRECVIVKAPPGAQNGIAIAAQIVSGAQARSKVIEIARIQAGRPATLPHQLQCLRGGIE